jgi:hypothetical protein
MYHNSSQIARKICTFSYIIVGIQNIAAECIPAAIFCSHFEVGSGNAQHLQHEGDPHYNGCPAGAVSTNFHVCLLLLFVAVILSNQQSDKPDLNYSL